MRYLLAIAIGPVQDFIRAGRKTRDLWYGSDLLSRVALTAAEFLNDHGELIFPHPEALTGATPVPNKLLVLLKENVDPKVTANKAHEKAAGVLKTDWNNLVTGARYTGWLKGRLDLTLATDQINGFLEWYAAWHPYHPATYAADRATLERLLAGRKALRDFSPAPMPSRPAVKKSSLDPARDSILRIDHAADETSVRSALHLSQGEEIDGVSLVKRLHTPDPPVRFVSLARVAIQPFVERAGLEALKPLDRAAENIRNIAKTINVDSPAEWFDTAIDGIGHFAAFPYDTQLFWDHGERDVDRLTRNIGAEDPLRYKGAEIADLRTRMRCFYDQAHELRRTFTDPKISEFPTYLAVLRADGDRMGAALNQIGDYEQHQRFSKRLSAFAESARKIVADHRGALVYSGGDDVLAFLPLHTALQCADALRIAFDAVNDPSHPRVTLSAGVAIGHYSEHLDHLLDWAAAAEHAAKHEGKRDALAVHLHTRSGGEAFIRSAGKWEESGVEFVRDRWLKWVEWHRRDIFPDGGAFDLRELADRLGSLPAATLAAPRYERKPVDAYAPARWSLLAVEVDRVLRRKRAGHGKEALKLTDEMIGAILTFMADDLEQLDRIVDELLIARRIATATDVAFGRPPKTETPDVAEEAANDGER